MQMIESRGPCICRALRKMPYRREMESMSKQMECKRLILRELSLEETRQLLEDGQDLLEDSVLTEEVLLAMVDKAERLRMLPKEARPWMAYWMIRARDGGRGIGLIGSKHLPDRQGYAELGYIMAAAHRGRGYMTEALRGFLGWMHTYPFCNGARLSIQETNGASLRVAEKCGFWPDGKKRGGYLLYRYSFGFPCADSDNIIQ